jgi:hypothetical protein
LNHYCGRYGDESDSFHFRARRATQKLSPNIYFVNP